MAAQDNNSAAAAVSGFFKSIGGFFADFGTAVVKGDAFVKLSLIWMGAGYAKRKQYVKAALMTLLEIAVIVFSVKFAMQYVPKFSTLGTVKMEKVFNMKTMKSEFNDYDNSFTILLFSLFSFVVWFAAAVVWFKNVINAYALQKMEETGKHINTANFQKAYLDKDYDEDEDVKIIRTKKFGIKPMYPEDACVQMELLGHNFFVFYNAETEQVNVVYKRKGNTYGLIEPEF